MMEGLRQVHAVFWHDWRGNLGACVQWRRVDLLPAEASQAVTADPSIILYGAVTAAFEGALFVTWQL